MSYMSNKEYIKKVDFKIWFWIPRISVNNCSLVLVLILFSCFETENVVKKSHLNLEKLLKWISHYNKLYSTKPILMPECDFFFKSKIQVAKVHLKYLSQFPIFTALSD